MSRPLEGGAASAEHRINILRAVSLAVNGGDYCGIADGDNTMFGELQSAILFTEPENLSDAEIVALFAAEVLS